MTPAPAPGPVPRLLPLLAVLLAISGVMAGGVVRTHQDYDDDDDDGPSPADNSHEDYADGANVTEPLGSTLGGPCFNSCAVSLQHVHCSPRTQRCECDDHFPVEVGPTRGCTTPVGLGDQCLYQAACQHWDQHARCTQVEHNAVCQCEPGFHTVSVHKAGRRTFCSEDLVLLTADLPTLLGVATGIALFTGVICFVLRLFVGGRPRDHFANANLAPSHILFSSDTGSEMSLRQLTAGKMALSLCRAGPSRLPLTGRSASRSGSQRSMSASGSLSRGLHHDLHGLHGGHGGPSSRAGAARAAALLLMTCTQLDPTGPHDNTDRDHEDDDDDDEEEEDGEDEDDDDHDERPPPVPTSTPPPLTPVESKPPPTPPGPPHAPSGPACGGPALASGASSCSSSPRHQATPAGATPATPPRTRASPSREAGVSAAEPRLGAQQRVVHQEHELRHASLRAGERAETAAAAAAAEQRAAAGAAGAAAADAGLGVLGQRGRTERRAGRLADRLGRRPQPRGKSQPEPQPSQPHVHRQTAARARPARRGRGVDDPIELAPPRSPPGHAGAVRVVRVPRLQTAPPAAPAAGRDAQ